MISQHIHLLEEEIIIKIMEAKASTGLVEEETEEVVVLLFVNCAIVQAILLLIVTIGLIRVFKAIIVKIPILQICSSNPLSITLPCMLV